MAAGSLTACGGTQVQDRPVQDRPVVITAPTPGAPAVVPPAPVAPAPAAMPAPVAARTWKDFRRQAALRLVQANPNITYTGAPPDPLLAIPVLEVELNADGSVRRIEVMRHPRQAKDTTQMAIDAVRRAAPYGDMRHLPRPWKFAEVFLFDDDRRFKPRTLQDP
ncbi:hypothetical protein [Aquabacterium sp. J223]|uniref:hypothetical protein n=1 Tax=Aquabacterium sp. J223 TaxID=2898431 RepID=UPI0021AD7396|nr:hypothetical protein [Aquabacterium sp. J223]UUX97091.1 hypothetical protein LRS07_07535 [Aquabacterium sp. J223]